MEPQKIEETVIKILKSSDLVTTTEFQVRVEASRQLGFDLSRIIHKKLVRSVVESFLLNDEGPGNPPEDAQAALSQIDVHNKPSRLICELSNKRKVVVRGFKGRSFVSIREFCGRGGMQQSSLRGINFTTEQWSIFRNNVPAIDDAIKKMQLKLRSDLSDQQSLKKIARHVSTPVTSCGGQVSIQVAANDEQIHQVSTQAMANGEQNQVPNTIPLDSDQSHQTSSSVTTSLEFIHLETNRFDGKNYRFWAEKMELFLKQLNVVYVLTDPCPSIAITQETTANDVDFVKAAERKWLNDDHICRHNILSSLSDSLYYRYSKNAQSAKELWEELKAVYLHEECETKRTLVKKYIEFQIVDEKSVLDQVHELNGIADSIVASGIFLDDNFHVSTIIAKFPPSWKDFRINLMRKEYLSFRMLIDRIRFEEEFRSQNKAGEPSYSVYSKYGYPRHTDNFGSRNCNNEKPGSQWKRREAEVHNKPVLFCNFCKKKGHALINCRSKNFGGERHYRDHKSKNFEAGERGYRGHKSKDFEAVERHYRDHNLMPPPPVAVEHNAG